MPKNSETYDFIKSKIEQLKGLYPSLREKRDDYVFSALCFKSNFYKNPSLNFNEQLIEEVIVDGNNDDGIDALLTDPNSDESDLVLIQSKFYQTIAFEDIVNAITKMVRFYNDMISGNYGTIQQRVTRRFLNLNAEVGDESKIIFAFYTSAVKGGIRKDKIEKAFKALIPANSDKFELRVFYADDICDEIKEAESRRPTVESGKLIIDDSNNYLCYGEDAIVVNISAFCIKQLYGTHGLNLLARNLRYHVTGGAIDSAIKDSIKNDPDTFWFKNNGITIICDDFDISGKEVKLKNFSIVNGGQTTYNLFKSNYLNASNDFYLPCKIIKVRGNNEDEKNLFTLEIAKATNSQKPIKPVDLKANSPEQVRFANSMRSNGIFYQTKRGEIVPKEFKDEYLNTDLAETGKLCLTAIFQLPATSRTRPKSLYNPEFYEPIFNGDQDKIAKLTKELLYIDYYFRKYFLKKFDTTNQDNPNVNELIPFAHNSRTICVAFSALASRYKSGNIDNKKLSIVFANIREGAYSANLYDIFRNVDSINSFYSADLLRNKDKFDMLLYELFDLIIKSGRKCYATERRFNSTLNETNYLKKDYNYYNILKTDWDYISEQIDRIFEKYQ